MFVCEVERGTGTDVCGTMCENEVFSLHVSPNKCLNRNRNSVLTVEETHFPVFRYYDMMKYSAAAEGMC